MCSRRTDHNVTPQCLERNPVVRLSINAMGKHPYFAAVYVLPSMGLTAN